MLSVKLKEGKIMEGSSVGQVLISGYDRFETFQTNRITTEIHTQKELTNQLEAIADLQSAFMRDRSQKVIDYSQSPMKEVVDRVRVVVPYLLKEGVYQWEDSQKVQELIDELRAQPQQIHPLIEQASTRIHQFFQERNQIADIVGQMLKEIREAILRYLTATRKDR